MILYTPLQLELVLEGLDTTKYPEYEEIQYKDIPMVVEEVGLGRKRIVKLLSTNPYDYLKPGISPGTIIKC